MRLDLVGPAPPSRGGISAYTAMLFAELRRRHDVRLLSFRRLYPRLFYPGRQDRVAGGAEAPAGAQPLIDGRNPLSWLRAARSVRRRRPHWLILSWWVVYWVPLYRLLLRAARRSGSRVLFLCHNVEEHEGGAWKRRLARRLLSRGHAFLVHSQAERKRLLELVGEPRAVAVAAMPSYEALNDRPLTRVEARRRRGLSADERIILFFGFVRPYKGLRVLLQAMPRVLQALPVRLLVAGEFWEPRRAYDELIDSLGLAGNVTVEDRYVANHEMASFFQAADVVALPYTHVTGSAIASLAVGFRRPVVASSIDPLPDVVVPRRTGLLVPAGDPVALGDALVDFFVNLREQEMRPHLEALNRRLSWPRLVDVLDDLMARAPGG